MASAGNSDCRGATVADPFGKVTWTNGIDLVGGSLQDVAIRSKDSKTWTPAPL